MSIQIQYSELRQDNVCRVTSDRDQHMSTRSIKTDKLQWKYQLIFVSNRCLLLWH